MGLTGRSLSSERLAGRSTAPVGRVSTAPTPLVGAGKPFLVGRGSRPFKTRERRNSSSSATPGFLVAAPVGRCISAFAATLAGRVALTLPARSPRFARSLTVRTTLAGKSLRNGSELTTRRASAASAGRARAPSAPKSRAVIDVTARSCAGFTRRRLASSSPRIGRRRSEFGSRRGKLPP